MAPPYTYPLAGVVYFMTHPQLWLKALCPFLLTLIVGILSLVLSFVYLLPLQAHALITAHCPVWLAWTVSVIFVLIESAVFDLLFYAIIQPFFQDALFDATLRARGLDRMFDTRIPVSGLLLCCRGVSSGLAFVWLLLLAQVVVLILTAPLHLIPVVGTVIACYINGWVACWGHHIHYDLEFRGFSVGDSRSFAWRHKAQYCSFGAVAVALELVPLFNLIFMWTNVVGAALWVGDKYEKNEREISRRQRTSTSNEIMTFPGQKDGYLPLIKQ
ncbi:uncharacterized protein B0P05DRAFT_526794 [Gilbertella persicaria]|uniref:uncharacterized protein n=1 Tax=Gilbertella persicaria TaxID=101096 RepID=UPI002220275A|nr:uncharacterized protein B0P05DRAFT_526794 [Gilbertella persicaria]KAI8091263.1 hypothetical protein B0P05DRAFT_526794 [Gilbertella persicaria]